MNVRDLSIRAKLFSMLGVYALGFAAVIALFLRQNQLERRSYTGVMSMKDLVADVLPPPKYIIESYLILLELSYEQDPATRAELIKQWDALKKVFEERQAFWQDTLADGALKQGLVRESTVPARALFAAADKQFLPAVLANDTAKAQALLNTTLHDLYNQHRAAINDVVIHANKQSDAYAREAVTTVDDGHRLLLLLGLAILAICMVFGWAVSRNIARRTASMVSALDSVAAGDLTLRIDDDSRDDLGKAARALNTAIGSMASALGEVQELSRTLTGAAGELSASAESIASGAHEQAASLEQTAASLEQITATVRQSSDNAQAASQLALGSRHSAERGGAVVTQANSAMTEIHQSSDKISNIITTIDEIAFQTNILALNAAVEAARAGEQGRGFAVVAAQVGTLSQRSSEAAKEIKGLIQDSVRKIAGGASLVSRSGQSLGEIVKSVTSVTDLVTEMAAAFREQSTGLDQISTAVAQMDEVMQSSSSQTDALSQTAQKLTHYAEHLRDLLARFRLEPAAATPIAAAAREPAKRAPSQRRTVPRLDTARPLRTARDPAAARREPPRAATAREPIAARAIGSYSDARDASSGGDFPVPSPPAAPADSPHRASRRANASDAAVDPAIAAMDEAMSQSSQDAFGGESEPPRAAGDDTMVARAVASTRDTGDRDYDNR